MGFSNLACSQRDSDTDVCTKKYFKFSFFIHIVCPCKKGIFSHIAVFISNYQLHFFLRSLFAIVFFLFL